MLRELFAPNIQRIKSIRAIGTMLQKVLLRFRIFLCGLVFAEAISSTFHASRLHRKNKVIIVLAIEIRHEPLLASKSLIDEQVLFIMAHRIAQIHILHTPAVAFKLMDDHPMKVLVVHGIVRAKSGSIIVIDDTVVGMRRIVCAGVCNERRNLALKLYVKRFEHIKSVAARLTAHNPIDIGIVVHADTKRSHRVEIRISAAVKRRVKRGKVAQRAYGIPLLLRFFNNAVIAQTNQVGKIRSIILVPLLPRRVKAIVRNTNLLAENRSLESSWRK